MGDPDRDEPSEPDADSEPESDRSDAADEDRSNAEADPGDRAAEETSEESTSEESTSEEETSEEETPEEETSEEETSEEETPEEETSEEETPEEEDPSESASYDLDEGGLFPDPETLDSDSDNESDDDDEADDSDGDEGDSDEDRGDSDGVEADAINEGTSPRPKRRRMRPKRDDGADDGDEEDDEADDDEADDDEADDGGPVSNGAGAVATGRDDDESLFEGPESDEEMPLADHIEEMMRRLGVVFLVAGIATLIAYPSADMAINYFWSSHIPDPQVNRPRVYGPLEFILTKLKVAGLAGLVVGLPVFVYETYLFMRPGLYPRERRYYLAAIPTSLVLATIGGLFAHFIVLPAIFAYFTAYTEGTAVIAFGLAETFNLIIILIGYMAIVFQIPLLIMLAIMMNLVTREWLEDKRLLFWGGFLGLSWLVTPDPTGMAPIIVTLTMIGLYEGTLALLRWTGN